LTTICCSLQGLRFAVTTPLFLFCKCTNIGETLTHPHTAKIVIFSNQVAKYLPKAAIMLPFVVDRCTSRSTAEAELMHLLELALELAVAFLGYSKVNQQLGIRLQRQNNVNVS